MGNSSPHFNWKWSGSVLQASVDAGASMLRMLKQTFLASNNEHNQAAGAEEIRREGPLKLYLGSRDLRPEGYLCVDIDPSSGPDIVADIRDMRPVADASCEEIVAGHVLEHLEWPESFRALAECARVLKPGGLFKVAVPDLRLLLDMVVSGEADFHAAGLLFGVGGRVNALEQHRYAFTDKMLRRISRILGFGEFDWWDSTLPEAANGWWPLPAEQRWRFPSIWRRESRRTDCGSGAALCRPCRAAAGRPDNGRGGNRMRRRGR